jgi:putative cell wall-binding protein
MPKAKTKSKVAKPRSASKSARRHSTKSSKRPHADKRKSHNGAKRWSQAVTEHSDALDLPRDVFTLDDPKAIAASLKRSAEKSHRRKSTPYRSAMSMLTFYLNRAGETLPAKRRRVLERAKDELRQAFGRK